MYGEDLQATRDAAWRALASNPVRRALLGRDRCDAIVRVAVDQAADVQADLHNAAGRDDLRAAVRRKLEDRVRGHYREQCGFAFTTFIVYWAISAIVQALMVRWWSQPQTEPNP